MPPIARAFIFLAMGAGLQAIVGFAITPALLGAAGTGTLVLALVGMAGAATYGFFAGLKDIYDFGPRGIAMFVIDVTWSALNTLTGLVFLIRCAANGIYQVPDGDSQKRGIIHFKDTPGLDKPKAALGGAAATTIGNVMGGEWMTHETIHVQQARIFGPFYWFTYLFGYFAGLVPALIAMIFPARRLNPHWESYGRVVMEDWAYHAAPVTRDPANPAVLVLRGPIRTGHWILWFVLASINFVAMAAILAPIPVLGAIPAAIGLGAIPWWIGMIVMLIYSGIRAFFTKVQD